MRLPEWNDGYIPTTPYALRVQPVESIEKAIIQAYLPPYNIPAGIIEIENLAGIAGRRGIGEKVDYTI